MGKKPMANITGTGGNDTLIGTPGDDTMDGKAGSDRLDGKAGNDILKGGPGGDRFILRKGGGHDTVIDFNPGQGDKILFDFGSWSDYMVFGRLYHGQSWNNFINTATFTVAGIDTNGDGKFDDCKISVSHVDGTDSITIKGWVPMPTPTGPTATNNVWGQYLTGG